jgi:hypothetical protein
VSALESQVNIFTLIDAAGLKMARIYVVSLLGAVKLI